MAEQKLISTFPIHDDYSKSILFSENEAIIIYPMNNKLTKILKRSSMSRKSEKLWDRDVGTAPKFETFEYTPDSDSWMQKQKNPQNTNISENEKSFGTANTIAVIVIIICMVFWTLVFLITAIIAGSPTLIAATFGLGISYWAVTWFTYWLGWKYYWIMLALGWVTSTGYMLTVITAITEAYVRLF